MEVVIAPAERLAVLAADAVEAVVRSGPGAVLGLATGSSPLKVYDELVRRHVQDGLSFAGVRAFMLDEYVGLPVDHPQRYRNVIETEIASRVDFAPGAVQGPDGNAADLVAACAAYEDAIAGRGCGPADPGDRDGRAHRVQRAGLVAGVAHADQDVDGPDA